MSFTDLGLKIGTRPDMPTDEIVIKEILEDNVYQVSEGDFVEGGVVIDIGANIGVFSLLAAKMGSKVIAFEPEPHNFAILSDNIHASGFGDDIVAISAAVTDKIGTTNIYSAGGDSVIEAERLKRHSKLERHLTQTTSLRSYLDREVSILKVDCEGAEYSIFEGLSSNDLKKVRYITMEFHATTALRYGKLLALLSLTHNVHCFGAYNKGGQIYARRY